jgi:hypothetical protein
MSIQNLTVVEVYRHWTEREFNDLKKQRVWQECFAGKQIEWRCKAGLIKPGVDVVQTVFTPIDFPYRFYVHGDIPIEHSNHLIDIKPSARVLIRGKLQYASPSVSISDSGETSISLYLDDMEVLEISSQDEDQDDITASSRRSGTGKPSGCMIALLLSGMVFLILLFLPFII